MLTTKYGKQYAEYARTATGNHQVSEKLMHKLAVQAPPKLLVEKYLIEIAKNYNIEYEPDPQVMQEDHLRSIGLLIDLSDKNNLGGSGCGGGNGGQSMPQPVGFIDYPQAPALPQMPMPPSNMPFNYPSGPSGSGNFGDNNSGGGGGGGGMKSTPFNYNIPPNGPAVDEKKDLNINNDFVMHESNNQFPPAYTSISPDDNLQVNFQFSLLVIGVFLFFY